MSLSRDKLLTDWRECLDAADAEPVGSSHRRAWLARVRRRLYRFLLSLYGDGQWRAATPPPADSASPAVFDLPEAESFAGKPAKDIGKIRSVLKAVASSQDHRPPAGSLTSEEVLTTQWFAVAAASSNLCLRRCRGLFKLHRLECRLHYLADDAIIEVPSNERYRAMALVEEHRASLRRPHRRSRPQRLSNAIAALLLIFVGPLICLTVFATLGTIAQGQRIEAGVAYRLVLACVATTGISAGAILWTWWRVRERPMAHRQRHI